MTESLYPFIFSNDMKNFDTILCVIFLSNNYLGHIVKQNFTFQKFSFVLWTDILCSFESYLSTFILCVLAGSF
jgi:hypothetical protein